MPELFCKDVIRTGRWWVPRLQAWLNVTPERMDQWVKTCKLMLDRGVSVDVTADHAEGAEAKRGQITELYRDGDKLMMKCNFADPASLQLAQRCPEVSLELEQDFEDGHGNKYDEAITAVTITRQPVIPGQEPFKKIAASRPRGRVICLSAADSKGGNSDSSTRNSKMAEENNSVSGISEQDVKDLARILNVDAEGSVEEIFKRILAEARELDGDSKDEDAGEMAEMAELGPAPGSAGAKAMWAQVSDAGKKTKKGGYSGMKGKWVKMGLSLHAVVDVLEDAKAAKLELSRKGSPEIDPDALEMAADGATTKLQGLVDACKITPACRDRLSQLMVGKSGEGKGIYLSRKAATHAGLASPIATAIIDALGTNEPGEIVRLQGEKSKSQKVTLSRQVPGGDAGLSQADKDAQAEMMAKAKNR